MARKTVAQTKDSITGLLTGLNLDNTVNLNTAMERTARELTQLISIPEARARMPITLYDGVVDYIGPTDGFSSFVDIRPQGNSRKEIESAYHNAPVDFDRRKNFITTGYHLTYEYVKGVGRLRVVSARPLPRIELDPLTETTGWTLSGSASSLTLDSTVFWNDPSSLRFNLTGSSVGVLTKTISSQDLTDYVGVGVVFLAIRTPNVANLTSMTIRLGSDASNYYEVTSTTGFLGALVVDEWILVALDLSGATTTGTPTVTAIDYTQVSVAHTASITNFYVGDLWISLPSPHDLFYATDAIFQASGANPSQTIASSADTILLNDDALLIYEHLSAINLAQQQGGTNASGIVDILESKLNLKSVRGRLGLVDLYRMRNPSQDQPIVTSYY